MVIKSINIKYNYFYKNFAFPKVVVMHYRELSFDEQIQFFYI